MVELDDEGFNARTLNCRLSGLNHIILPKRVVAEYSILPYDIVGLLGKRAKGTGVIAFEVPVHRYNNSVVIPQQIVDFCGFIRGIVCLKLIGIRHTGKLARVLAEETEKREKLKKKERKKSS